LRHEKKGRLCLVAFADFCGKEMTGGLAPLCDATPPAEYLIICSD
jgi:hypothetical protein